MFALSFGDAQPGLRVPPKPGSPRPQAIKGPGVVVGVKVAPLVWPTHAYIWVWLGYRYMGPSCMLVKLLKEAVFISVACAALVLCLICSPATKVPEVTEPAMLYAGRGVVLSITKHFDGSVPPEVASLPGRLIIAVLTS